mgnify:FL=1
MENKVPDFLYNMLIEQYGEEVSNKIIDGFGQNRKLTLRINKLKTAVENVKKVLTDLNIKFSEVSWSEEALIIEGTTKQEILELEIYKNGEIYLQSLSSMIPALILNPETNENILDMAAAPGGKTTQMSAISNNLALITACEKNKIRAERLKYNIQKQGANRVNVLVEDSRKLDDNFSFDKILLDAPCSGSGTINIFDEKLNKYFTKELVDRSIKTQKELLQKAIKVLKKGGEMVYSTCSILKQENEENIEKFLKNNQLEIVPIDIELLKDIPLLPSKIEGVITVCPNELYEGFFVAKLRKK